ncbi:MAG: hypothetical protein IJU95_02180 [Treponema sp.]|nr:hypothetical protein [Treponema sp.]
MKAIGKLLLAVLLLAPLPAFALDAGTQLIVSSGAAGNGGGRDSTWGYWKDDNGCWHMTLLSPAFGKAHQVSNAKLIGWFDLPFNDESTFGLMGQGSIKYSQENSWDSISYINIIPDVDMLRYYFNKVDGNGGFSLSLGRFNVADKTSSIINQKIDGLYVGYSASRIQFGAYVGYTGLLNSKNTMIINSSGRNYWSSQLTGSIYDFLLEDIDTNKNNRLQFASMKNKVFSGRYWDDVERTLYIWADPYLVSSANITFPYLFANQTPYIEGSLAISTEGPCKVEDEFDRFYITAGMYGPLIYSDLVYNVSTTFSTYGDSSSSKSAFDGVSNLSKIKLTYFTGFHSLAISGLFTYASGDNGMYEPFYGFTSNPISYRRYSPEHSSSVKYGLSASFKPIREFLVTLGADQLFDYSTDYIKYEGIQAYTEMKLQCTSDFQFQLKAYRFWAEDKTFDNTGATITGVFSF